MLSRLIFDYSITQFGRRCSQLRLLPGSALPAVVAGGAVDIFVLGGDLRIGGETILGGGFAVIEPDAQVMLRSGYGCLFFAWAEGRARWCDDAAGDPFGF